MELDRMLKDPDKELPYCFYSATSLRKIHWVLVLIHIYKFDVRRNDVWKENPFLADQCELLGVYDSKTAGDYLVSHFHYNRQSLESYKAHALVHGY